jgi:hypothetical protein
MPVSVVVARQVLALLSEVRIFARQPHERCDKVTSTSAWFMYVLYAAAVSWWMTALTYKDGPFDIFKKFRDWNNETFGQYSPFKCSFCTGPYILVPVFVIQQILPFFVPLFGILGLAATLRGQSQEF